MVGTTAFQNGSFQRVTCDSKLAVESARFEKRQLRLPQSKCRTHRRVSLSRGASLLLSADVAFQLGVDQAATSDCEIVLRREPNVADRQRKAS